ncbi:MAG: putative DNA-binding protein [Clostridia bacterium]|nr:putative DNA-binding protein [Clostridia bacterium]
MLEKRDYLILLFDFYSALLTEKQRLIFDLYYQDDLSLGEIAEQLNISRQAVYDIIKRSENILEDYENKLKLVKKFQNNKEKLQQVLALVNELENTINNSTLAELKKIVRDVINEG